MHEQVARRSTITVASGHSFQWSRSAEHKRGDWRRAGKYLQRPRRLAASRDRRGRQLVGESKLAEENDPPEQV